MLIHVVYYTGYEMTFCHTVLQV